MTKINNEEHIITPEKGETVLETKENQQVEQKPRKSFATNAARMDTCHLIVQT
jgi:hypothetical protein